MKEIQIYSELLNKTKSLLNQTSTIRVEGWEESDRREAGGINYVQP